METRPSKLKVGCVFLLAIVLAAVMYVQWGRFPSAFRQARPPGKPLGKADLTPLPSDAIDKEISELAAKWQPPSPVGRLARDPMSFDVNESKVFVKEEAPVKVTTIEGAPVKLEEAGPSFVVIGIFYSKDISSSIIVDGQILHEGDKFLGITIEKIEENEVVFEKDGKRWILQVGQKSE